MWLIIVGADVFGPCDGSVVAAVGQWEFQRLPTRRRRDEAPSICIVCGRSDVLCYTTRDPAAESRGVQGGARERRHVHEGGNIRRKAAFRGRDQAAEDESRGMLELPPHGGYAKRRDGADHRGYLPRLHRDVP